MRDAILSTRRNGTLLVEVFNRHQAKVVDSMVGKSCELVGFDALKNELVSRLEINKKIIHDGHYGIMQRDAVDFTIGILGPIDDLFVKLDKKTQPRRCPRDQSRSHRHIH